jgi:hypothetical protein
LRKTNSNFSKSFSLSYLDIFCRYQSTMMAAK